jgi:hypothetical protein
MADDADAVGEVARTWRTWDGEGDGGFAGETDERRTDKIVGRGSDGRWAGRGRGCSRLARGRVRVTG